ncbi:MAG: outer membrane lipoprotein chaperone LolA [Gammaproteobacteria bacterium]
MRKLIAAALLFCAPWAAAAEDGVSLLLRFLQNTPTAKITFQQTSLDGGGNIVGESRGRFWHRRPNFFRMEYDPPDGIVVVSDGATLWTYERDLQQVLVQPASAAAGNSALLDVLASGDLSDLRGGYILSSGVGGDLRWAHAETRAEDQTIRRMRLGFAEDGRLLRVEMTDAFGGVAKLEVESVLRKPPDDSVFRFVPPEGVDIVREE